MKHRRLTKEEEKKWVKLYWALIDHGATHIEAYTHADNRIYKEDKRVIIVDKSR